MVFTLISASTLARDKNRKGERSTGKLVGVEEGTPESVGYLSGNPTSIIGASSECRNWVYTVETETMIYTFSAHTGAWCADHPRPFTVGKEVKFMIEAKGKAFLVDDEGEEFKASVVKKVAKQTPH